MKSLRLPNPDGAVVRDQGLPTPWLRTSCGDFGHPVSSWPITLWGEPIVSAAKGDIDADNSLEVIVPVERDPATSATLRFSAPVPNPVVAVEGTERLVRKVVLIR